jgi:hypothetical protein
VCATKADKENIKALENLEQAVFKLPLPLAGQKDTPKDYFYKAESASDTEIKKKRLDFARVSGLNLNNQLETERQHLHNPFSPPRISQGCTSARAKPDQSILEKIREKLKQLKSEKTIGLSKAELAFLTKTIPDQVKSKIKSDQPALSSRSARQKTPPP